MLTTARSQEKIARKIIACQGLLPDNKQFKEILQSKNELLTITFHTLWVYLNQLKTHEMEYKKAATAAAYETESIQRALDISPTILAVETLLTASLVNRSKEEIREKIIFLFLSSQDTETIKKTLQQYYAGIKADRNTPDVLLDEKKLNHALSITGSVGTFFGTYSYAEKAFFQSFASTFYKLSRIELTESLMYQNIQKQKKCIYDLSQEIKSLSFSDPITQLDKLFTDYTHNLKSSVARYEAKKFNFIADPQIIQLKEMINEYILAYQKSVDDLIEKISNYPENLRETILKIVRKAENLQTEKIRIKKRFLVLRKKQIDEYQLIQSNLEKELKNEPGSKKRLLTDKIHTTPLLIQSGYLPDTKQFEKEIALLEKTADSLEKTFEAAYRRPLIYSQKINRLIEEKLSFERDYFIEHKKIFSDLLAEYKKTYLEFVAIARKLGLIDKNGDIEIVLTAKIPHEEISLTSSLVNYSHITAKELDELIKSLQSLLAAKSIPVRELFKTTLESENNPNQTENEAFKQALQKLPALFQKKVFEYKAQFLNLCQNANLHLIQQGKAAFEAQALAALTEFDLKIHNIEAQFQRFDFESRFAEKAEDALLDEIIHDITEERAKKILQQKSAEAKNNQVDLEQTKKHEKDTQAEKSSQPTLVTERARVRQENQNSLVKKHLQESAIQILSGKDQAIFSSYSIKSLAVGVVAGFMSLIIAPVAWLYGAYQLGIEIKKKTDSTIYSIVASISSFIFMPIAWAFGGVKIAQRSMDSYLSSKKQTPLFTESDLYPKKTDITSLPLYGIKLPPLSFKEMFKKLCERKVLPMLYEENHLCIKTLPKNIFISENNSVLLKNQSFNVRLRDPAICLLLRILYVIDRVEDIIVDIKQGFLFIEVFTGSTKNTFFISPGNNDDKNLIYVNKNNTSHNKIPLLPQQFNSDEKLKKILYQPSTPQLSSSIPIQRTDSPPSMSFKI